MSSRPSGLAAAFPCPRNRSGKAIRLWVWGWRRCFFPAFGRFARRLSGRGSRVYRRYTRSLWSLGGFKGRLDAFFLQFGHPGLSLLAGPILGYPHLGGLGLIMVFGFGQPRLGAGVETILKLELLDHLLTHLAHFFFPGLGVAVRGPVLPFFFAAAGGGRGTMDPVTGPGRAGAAAPGVGAGAQPELASPRLPP